MQTTEQLRAKATHLREAGLHAEGKFGAEDLAEAGRLEQIAAALEAGPAADEVKRLRQQLNRKDSEIEGLTKSITWLRAIIAYQIGRPVDGMTGVKMAFKLDDAMQDQGSRLALAIAAAEDMEGLNKVKAIAQDMGLIGRENAV